MYAKICYRRPISPVSFKVFYVFHKLTWFIQPKYLLIMHNNFESAAFMKLVCVLLKHTFFMQCK